MDVALAIDDDDDDEAARKLMFVSLSGDDADEVEWLSCGCGWVGACCLVLGLRMSGCCW